MKRRVVFVHKEGSKNKLFMMMLRERINGWVEESGMLGVSERDEGQREYFYAREDD